MAQLRTLQRKRQNAKSSGDPLLEIVDEAEAKSVSVGLMQLVRFLNAASWGGGKSGGESKVRDEIIRDIEPIVRRSEDAKKHLKEIVEKTNNLVKARWTVEPAVREMKIRTRGKLVATIPWPLDLGPGRGILKIGRGRLAVRHDFFDASSLRKRFYATIITALEDGEFVRLGRCLRIECQKFFIESRLGQKYCDLTCTKEADKKKARKRARDWREEKREERELQSQQKAEHQAFDNFRRFMAVARKRKHGEEEQARLRLILKALGKGDVLKGWQRVKVWEKQPDKQTWQSLSNDERKLFESAEKSKK